jgi:exopolysaccharide biosynthesis polyprenyl glycosylphosphotransferase
MRERLWQTAIRTVVLVDLGLTVLALLLAVQLRTWLPFGAAIEPSAVPPPLVIYPAVVAIWLLAFLIVNPQRAIFQSSLGETLGRTVASVGIATLMFAGLLYLSYRDMSRLLFFYFASFDLLFLLLSHLIVRVGLRSGSSQKPVRVLIVGAGKLGRSVANEIEANTWHSLQVIGYLDDDEAKQRSGIDSLPVFGSCEEVCAIVAAQGIDEVIFALPPTSHQKLMRLALQLEQQPVRVHMAPDVIDLAFTRTSVETIGGLTLISLREPMLSPAARLAKRSFDLGVSLLLLAICSPLMLLIGYLIKRDSPGPVIYRSWRVGENGKRFEMLKFRTMYLDAERRWQEVAQRSDDGSLLHKLQTDPRITPFGRLLRRSSLDELPQLFNVVRGEMSLVGPRPEVPYVVDEYDPWQWRRFAVQPGITGWWQINGRSDRPMHLHTQDDLYYIQHYSLWLDLKILWRTIGVVFRGKGAF